MYAVSDAYKNAMKQPVQHFSLRGIIDNKIQTATEFRDENVLQFGITNQCTGSGTVKIGGVYIGELSASFANLGIDSWDVYSGKTTITPYVSRKLADSSYEEIPLGIYTISEVNKTAFGVNIVAYDNMHKFDKPYDGYVFSGSIYNMADLACRLCGVEFGMTQSQVEALPNGTYAYFILYPDNDVDTYRDVISYLAQLIGGFATIDRDGKLVFRCFGTAAADTVSDECRISGATFSEFQTVYNRILCYDNINEKQLVYSDPIATGSYMDLGANPFLQYGLPATKKILLLNILHAISPYADPDHAIHYTPFKSSMLGDPAYDLGDVIAFSGGIAPEGTIGCIMAFDWEYNDSYDATGYGSDPKLEWAKTAADKAIGGLGSSMNTQQMHYYNYINAAAVRLNDGDDKKVVSIHFVAIKATEVNFFAEIKLDVNTSSSTSDDYYTCTEGTLIAIYSIGSAEIGWCRPQWTLQDGIQTIHLFFHFSLTGTDTGEFSVRFMTKDCAVQMEKYWINATLEGTFLAGDGAWDGMITVDDYIDTPVSFTNTDMDFHLQNTSVSPSMQAPETCAIQDKIQLTVTTIPLAFGSLSDTLSNSLATTRFLLNAANPGTYDSSIIAIKNDAYQLIDDSVSGQISKTADLQDQTGISSLECKYTGIVTIQYSYDGSTWTEQQPMADFLKTDLNALYSGMTAAKQIAFRITLEGNATLTEFIVNYVL